MAAARLPGYRDLDALLATDPLPARWALLGDAQTIALKEDIEAEIGALLERRQGTIERLTVDLKEAPASDALTLALSMPLWGSPRLVSVHAVESLTKAHKEAFLAELTAAPPPPPITVVLWVGGRDLPSGPWDRALTRMMLWPPRQDWEIAPWLERILRRKGLAPAPGLARTLLELYGTDLLRIRSEVQKAGLMAGPPAGPTRRVTPELVHSVAVPAGPDVFGVLDGIATGDLSRGLARLPALLAAGESPEMVLILLLTQVRHGLTVMALVSGPAGPEAQGPKASRPPPGGPDAAGRLEELVTAHRRTSGRFFDQRRIETEVGGLVKSLAMGTPFAREVGSWPPVAVMAAARTVVGLSERAVRDVHGTILSLDTATRGGGLGASLALELIAIEIARRRGVKTAGITRPPTPPRAGAPALSPRQGPAWPGC